jgi:large subunit ribosomal protein L23
MNQERIMNILLAPHISEKSTTVGEKHNQVVFKVIKDANKLEVKAAVESLFNVKVKNVRIANVKGKTRNFRQIAGKRKDWKKAYVSLAEGQDINFAGKEN